MKAFKKHLLTEGRLSVRDMNMVVFAIIMPVIVLVILGILYGDRPAFPGADYSFLEQSFGALCSISICAGGLMGLPLVVAEYRERKILKRFHVTPVRPIMLLMVHLCIYGIYAAVSAFSLWLITKIFWGFQFRGGLGIFFAGWLLVLVSTLSIGILVGGIARNSKSASVIASILYFPMLVFSGATLPYEVMPDSMQKIVSIFPFTQGIKLLKASVLGLPLTNMVFCVMITVIVAAGCTIAAVKWFRWE